MDVLVIYLNHKFESVWRPTGQAYKDRWACRIFRQNGRIGIEWDNPTEADHSNTDVLAIGLGTPGDWNTEALYRLRYQRWLNLDRPLYKEKRSVHVARHGEIPPDLPKLLLHPYPAPGYQIAGSGGELLGRWVQRHPQGTDTFTDEYEMLLRKFYNYAGCSLSQRFNSDLVVLLSCLASLEMLFRAKFDSSAIDIDIRSVKKLLVTTQEIIWDNGRLVQDGVLDEAIRIYGDQRLVEVSCALRKLISGPLVAPTNIMQVDALYTLCKQIEEQLDLAGTVLRSLEAADG